jgi:hypothetical protein
MGWIDSDVGGKIVVHALAKYTAMRRGSQIKLGLVEPILRNLSSE